MAFNSMWIYTLGFAKYDSAAEIGISDAELTRVAQELRSYFNNGYQRYPDINVTYNDGLTGPVFTQNEMAHLKDVKGLLWLDYAAALISAVYIMMYTGIRLHKLRSRAGWELARDVWHGGLLTCVILVFVGFFAITRFDWLFDRFHKVFFLQGNFLFSPYDHIILMFPFDFWSDVALLMGLLALVCGALVAGMGLLTLRQRCHFEKSLEH